MSLRNHEHPQQASFQAPHRIPFKILGSKVIPDLALSSESFLSYAHLSRRVCSLVYAILVLGGLHFFSHLALSCDDHGFFAYLRTGLLYL